MKNVMKNIRISLLVTLGLGFLLTVIYPLAVWAVAQVVFPDQANGSLIRKDGKIIGSELLGQKFASPAYFHTRPSAAGAGYDAASSGGSNLGPISAKFLDGIPDDPSTADVDESYSGLKQRVDAYRQVNALEESVRIPVDAVTASGSGLDPHISPANAHLQMPRVARERGLSEEVVRALIQENTDGRDFWILGDPGVNVVKLNLALDAKATQNPQP